MPARIAPSRRSSRFASGAVLLALGLGGLTACGGSDPGTAAGSTTSASSSASSAAAGPSSGSSSEAGSSQAEAVTATEKDFSIALDEDSLKAGTYTITVKNDGNATHDLAVERDGTTTATSDSIGPGDSTTLTVDLAPGKYVFYCSIGNHRAMGMETTVTVS